MLARFSFQLFLQNMEKKDGSSVKMSNTEMEKGKLQRAYKHTHTHTMDV